MKRIVFVISIVFFIQTQSFESFSQDQTQDEKSYKNYVTFNITRLILMEARFGYERHLSERHVLRSTLGLQYPISSESFSSINFLPAHIPFYYAVSNGAYFALGYNYIIRQRSNLYVSTEVYFNYSYYDEKYYKFCVGTDHDSYVSLQSMQLKKSGIKLLIGKKANILPGQKTRLQFDIFAGIGFQYREEEITIFKKKQGECSVEGQYSYEDYNPHEKEISNRWWPALHAGILIGMPF